MPCANDTERTKNGDTSIRNGNRSIESGEMAANYDNGKFKNGTILANNGVMDTKRDRKAQIYLT